MLATIEPRRLSGTVPAIASKSVAHRMIIAAALSSSTTHVICNTTCEDIDATVRCLAALGARIEKTDDGFEVHPIAKSIELGILKAFQGATLDCGESGSTLRFMLPVACALGADATFIGSERLGQRPLSPLDDELVAAGCGIEREDGFPLRTSGRIRPGRFTLPGTVSSQYITGLLLAAPLLPGACEIEVVGRIESRPYINITLQVLKQFGIEVRVDRGVAANGIDEVTRFCTKDRSYRSPGEVRVEGDWSNAAFWLCAGALGTAPIEVAGVSLTSAQGDRNVLAALSRFGARTRRSADSAIVQPDQLHAFSMSAQDIPDLVPVIAAVASCCEGTTVIRDCARLRIKESDRLATTASELNALGAQVDIDRDSLVIHGVGRLRGGVVDAHNDHRIAMMAAIAAIRCEGTVTIRGAQAVQKSYPQFFDHYRLLGGQVELTEA
ncbi:3-phosphoshikimate 1-carboxyvinyltransferase [Collinsella tanakaei]|uniref:3-phosphoshikimate 1-carboxyvinyltransferase n=1 Tax=Collinsella tanakaei TaxID=626935 RepID=UPI0025A34C3C|nr:3-phosphoshikimate 1-carboxyvinyltransferase [Collinsella tanakaei]MDM8301307.1 3-phosphoshikimate 1-carboxyvinyltransferase [Collinsella tanakaei]